MDKFWTLVIFGLYLVITRSNCGNETEGSMGNDLVSRDVIVVNSRSKVRSYVICQRNNNSNESITELIHIPTNLEELINISLEFPRHKGLEASFAAIQRQRSPKNVYILVIADTLVTSTINLLLKNVSEPLEDVFAWNSSIPTVVEFISTPIHLPKFGISNSQLHVITVPIEDSSNVNYNAKIIATLLKFLGKSEELRETLPNVALAISSCDDEKKLHQQFGQTLEPFQETFLEENGSNWFYLCSNSTIQTQKIVAGKQELDFNEVKTFLLEKLLPRLVEHSDAIAVELLNEFSSVLQRGGIYNNNVSFRMNVLQSPNDTMLQNVLQVLSQEESTRNTEIGKMLAEVYASRVDWKLKKSHPGSLQLLQILMYTRNITTATQVPVHRKDLVPFLQLLHASETSWELKPSMLTLLQTAFPIRVPEFPLVAEQLIGFPYDMSSDTSVEEPIFDFGRMRYVQELGMSVPNTFKLGLAEKQVNYVKFHKNINNFLISRLKALKVTDVPLNESNFKGELKPRDNILNFIPQNVASTKFTILREFRSLNLNLDLAALELTPEFRNKINYLPLFNLHDQNSVEEWKQFLFDYGTHVVTSGYVGGYLEVTVEVSGEELRKLKVGNTSSAVKFMNEVLENPAKYCLIGNITLDGNVNNNISDFNVLSMYLSGGAVQYQLHKINLITMSPSEGLKILDEWKDSLRYQPIMLDTSLTLLPLAELVILWNKTAAGTISKAVNAMFDGNLEYIPPTPAATLKPAPVPGQVTGVTIAATKQRPQEQTTQVPVFSVHKQPEQVITKLNQISTKVVIPTKEDFEENNAILDCLQNFIERLDAQIQESSATDLTSSNLTELANQIESLYNRIAQDGRPQLAEKARIQRICNTYGSTQHTTSLPIVDLQELIQKAHDDEKFGVNGVPRNMPNSVPALTFPELQDPVGTSATKQAILSKQMLAVLSRSIWANATSEMRVAQQITDFKYIGYGFNIFQQGPTSRSPFILTENSFVKTELCGIEDGQLQSQVTFRYLKSKYEYLKLRLQEVEPSSTSSEFLLAQITTPISKYTGQILPGYSLLGDITSDSESVSVFYEFRIQFVKLRPQCDMHLNEEFRSEFSQLPNFDRRNCSMTSKWNQFFKRYGTQLIREAYLGGALEIRAFNQSKNQILYSRHKPDALKELLYSGKLGNTSDTNFRVFGGHSNVFVNYEKGFTAGELKAWTQSIQRNLTVLPTHLRLENMYKIVNQHLPSTNATAFLESINFYYTDGITSCQSD